MTLLKRRQRRIRLLQIVKLQVILLVMLTILAIMSYGDTKVNSEWVFKHDESRLIS
jgi:hypothetical protein